MDRFVGKRLDGRYELMSVVGVGGMAVVYKARDIIDDRIVAVKILKDEFHNNEEFRRRFKTECKAIAVLSHPNIVKIYDVSFGDRLEYIVMEYIEGITLKEYIRQQGAVRWSEAVHFAVQILRALQHAHDKGIVHSDIKSQNIMLMQNGDIKVTDFGIARFNRIETRENANGQTIGSVHYISPEQARGERVDERSDIYSTGIIMYEMLTGKLPFDGTNPVSVAIKQMESEPVAPRKLNVSIPEGLEQITLKAMTKDVNQRYQSAIQMLEDIEKFKKNPSILFQYKYNMVDEKPIQFTPAKPNPPERNGQNTVMKQNRNTTQNKNQKANTKKKKYVYYDDDDYDLPKRRSILPLLAGVIAAFFLFGSVCIVYIDELTGIFTQDQRVVEVPYLIGMDYQEANEEYRESLILNVMNEEYNTEYPEGTIIKQSRTQGQKISKLSTIDVVLSRGTKGDNVPDVYGQDQSSAESAIKNAGFTAQVVLMGDNDTPEGCVIKTEPERNKPCDAGDTVIIYISNGKISNPVSVPDLTSCKNVNEAKAKIEAAGLKYGATIEKNSGEKKGTVIGSAPASGTSVEEGSSVNIIVSNEMLAQKSVNISIPLPRNASNDVYLKIYQDDELIEQTTALSPSANKYYQVEMFGSGETTVRVTISAYANEGYSEYYLYNVNYSTGKVSKSNSYDYKEPKI